MALFYWNIKGRTGEGYGSNWSFPPIWTDFIEAKDRKEARALIEEQYGSKFPARSPKNSEQQTEFLLTVKEVKQDDKYTLSLNELKTCKNKDCGAQYRVIEKYQQQQTGGGHDYCSYACSKINQPYEFTTHEGTSASMPVIYKITNKVTGKCYIGQTTQVFTLRWYQHFFQSTNTKFHKEIKNYSASDWSFEIIECIDKKLLNIESSDEMKRHLNERESYYIGLYDSIANGYNTQGKGENIPTELENQGSLFEPIL